jgi:small subunit ribosomal protein S6
LRTYEVSYIAAPNVADDDLAKLTSLLEHIVTDRGGKVTKVDAWGRRKLAYSIGKFEEGLYTILFIEGTGQEISEVERRLRVTDFVIRHMTVRTDEDLKRAEKMKARRKSAVAAPRPADDDDFDAEDNDDEV